MRSKFSFALGLLLSTCPLFAADHPNIIILLADDLGWTDIHTGSTTYNHGDSYVQTPAIDHLATQGISLSNMHASPNCAPARAALMTGQYAIHNGVYNVGSLDRGAGALDPAKQRSQHITHEAVTVAETLKTAGYITCQVGKFHVSTHDEITQFDGFDVNYGGGRKGDATPKGYFAVKDKSSPTGWEFINLGPEMQAFAAPYTKEYIDQNLTPYANGNDPSSLVGTRKHLTDADADAAIDFLTKHLASPDKDKPFFMNVAFNAVHAAIRPRPDLVTKYNRIKSNDPRHTRADYAALTEGEDQAIARILRFLDEHHLSENTLVLFTSDNGGASPSTINEPLRGFKGMFYEGGLRVPAIVRLPGVIKPGSNSDAMLNFVDIYPTFADFAGAKLPDSSVYALDGQSFAPLLRGETTSSSRTVTYYHFPGYLDTRAFPCSTIIKKVADKNYKLFYSYEDQHYELYNLTDDLSEKDDLLKGGHPTDASLAIANNLQDDLSHYLQANQVIMAQSKTTHQPVPFPIPVKDALQSGNHITRTPAPKSGPEGNSD